MTPGFWKGAGHLGGRPFFLGLLLGVCCAGVTAARPPQGDGRPSAERILARAETIRSPELDYAVDFTLVVTNPDTSWKERSAAYTMIAAGKDHSLIVMRRPETFYPGTLLIADGLYYLLLPRSTRAVQLSSRHVLNGDISNGDLARGNLERYYTPALVGTATTGGVDCWHLDLARRNPRALYPRIEAWVAKDDARPIRFDYYGHTGALLKRARYHDYRRGALGLRAMRIEVENGLRPTETTTMTFDDLRAFDPSGIEFTMSGMRAFRDRALDWRERNGGQGDPEQFLAPDLAAGAP